VQALGEWALRHQPTMADARRRFDAVSTRQAARTPEH